MIAGIALLIEEDARVASAGGLDVFDVEFFEELFAAGGLLRFGGVGTKPLDERLEFFAFFVGFFVAVGELLGGQLAGFVPEGVVARVELCLGAVDVHDMGTDGIEEVAVVGDDDDGVFEVGQEVFEPKDGLYVKVVGRFVQEQDVGITKECLGKQDPYFFLVGEVFHELVVRGFGDVESAQE